MIRIRAKVNGFRRAGMAHSADWKVYPDDKFSKEQLKQLEKEPMLQVERVPGDPEPTAETRQSKKSGK